MLIVVHFIVALSELLRAKVRAGCMKFEVQHCIYIFFNAGGQRGQWAGHGGIQEVVRRGSDGGGQGVGSGEMGGRRGGQKLTTDFGQA